ncbi:MAG: hypothetical protein HQL15_07245 [Candidatus Omnitrophica bacterium]|nr:hypothetical protein [Candidatus Omnitrophota bacterium]
MRLTSPSTEEKKRPCLCLSCVVLRSGLNGVLQMIHRCNSFFNRFRPWISFFLLFLILGIVCSPAIYFNYLHHDEACFWLNLFSYKQNLADEDWAIGRYAAAVLLNLQGLFVHRASDVTFLRFLAILLLSGNAYMLLRRVSRFSWSYLQAFLIVLAISILPGFADGVFCASNVYVICSVFLACWSFCRAEDGRGFFIPSVAFLASIMFYPSGAMFYWTMVGMSMLFVQDRFAPIFIKKLFRVTGIGLISLLSYAVLIFLMSFYYSHKIQDVNYSPYKLAPDWIGKLRWFLQEPLLNALNLWCIFPKWLTALIIAGFIILTVLIMSFRGLKQIQIHNRRDVLLTYVWQSAFFIFIFFMTFLPNLAAGFNAAFYRCLIPLTSLIILVLIWASLQWIKLIPISIGRPILTGLLSMAVIYGGVTTFDNVLYYRVLPSHIEWNAFRVMAQSIPFKKTDSIYIICSNHIPQIERYDEFGVLTSHYRLDMFPLLVSAFSEEEFGSVQLPLTYISYPQDNRILSVTKFVYKKFSGEKWVLKNIANGDLTYLDSFPAQDNIGSYERRVPVNAEEFLRKNHPYILDLRQMFSLSNYYQLIHRDSLEKQTN